MSDSRVTLLDDAAGARWTYGHRGYAIAHSWRQLMRRKLSSATTLFVLGITLALPAIILFSADALESLAGGTLQEESLTAYLSVDTQDLEGAALARELLNQLDVRETRYVSRDEALATFRAHSDVGEALDALGENPLPGAIIVYPVPDAVAGSIDRLANRLRALPAVERVQFDLKWVERLQSMLALVRLAGWVLAGFLTLTALMVIGNTVRLELLRREQELAVSRLLGAQRRFLNRPLLYTGALYGLLAGVLACVVAVAVLYGLRGPTDDLAALYASAFRLKMPTASQFFTVIGVSTALGLCGAWFTLYTSSRQIFQTRRLGI